MELIERVFDEFPRLYLVFAGNEGKDSRITLLVVIDPFFVGKLQDALWECVFWQSREESLLEEVYELWSTLIDDTYSFSFRSPDGDLSGEPHSDISLAELLILRDICYRRLWYAQSDRFFEFPSRSIGEIERKHSFLWVVHI